MNATRECREQTYFDVVIVRVGVHPARVDLWSSCRLCVRNASRGVVLCPFCVFLCVRFVSVCVCMSFLRAGSSVVERSNVARMVAGLIPISRLLLLSSSFARSDVLLLLSFKRREVVASHDPLGLA